MLIEVSFNFYLLLGLALFLSLTINLLFIFKVLANKYPSLFYEEVEE